MVEAIRALFDFHPAVQIVAMGAALAATVLVSVFLVVALTRRRLRMRATAGVVLLLCITTFFGWLWLPTDAEMRSVDLRLAGALEVGRSSDVTDAANSATRWFLADETGTQSLMQSVRGARINWELQDPVVYGDETQLARGQLTRNCGVLLYEITPTGLLPSEVHLSLDEAARRSAGRAAVVGLSVVCS